jgi:hypothetical protein
MPKYINERELAEMLGRAPHTLAKWRLRGVGPRYAKPAGGHVIYDVADVEAWIETQKVSSTSDQVAEAA